MKRRVFLTICAGAALPAKETSVRIGHRVFPGLGEMDGNWAALLAASDGKVYAGLANHGGDGHLVYYESKQERIHDVGNLTELCGESHFHRGPQSKIHAKFGEGKDGRIYFGTHGGLWWDYARFDTKEGYPGAHWMAFDPKTGRVEDFGIGPRNEGINTGAYDPQFNRIYGLTHPRAHFVYYDVATRRTADLGRFDNWESICRTLELTAGNVYGSFGQGQVFKYDPRTDTIRELSVRVPIRPKGTRSAVIIKNPKRPGERSYGIRPRIAFTVSTRARRFFFVRSASRRRRKNRKLGQLCIPGFEDRRDIPYATLSLTMGHNRKLYDGAAAASSTMGAARAPLRRT